VDLMPGRIDAGQAQPLNAEAGRALGTLVATLERDRVIVPIRQRVALFRDERCCLRRHGLGA